MDHESVRSSPAAPLSVAQSNELAMVQLVMRTGASKPCYSFTKFDGVHIVIPQIVRIIT